MSEKMDQEKSVGSISGFSDFVRKLEDRLADGDKRMCAIEKELKDQTETLGELRELLTLGKNGLRVLGWLGGGVVWVAKAVTAVGAAGGAVYLMWYQLTHGGNLPPR